MYFSILYNNNDMVFKREIARVDILIYYVI